MSPISTRHGYISRVLADGHSTAPSLGTAGPTTGRRAGRPARRSTNGEPTARAAELRRAGLGRRPARARASAAADAAAASAAASAAVARRRAGRAPRVGAGASAPGSRAEPRGEQALVSRGLSEQRGGARGLGRRRRGRRRRAARAIVGRRRRRGLGLGPGAAAAGRAVELGRRRGGGRRRRGRRAAALAAAAAARRGELLAARGDRAGGSRYVAPGPTRRPPARLARELHRRRAPPPRRRATRRAAPGCRREVAVARHLGAVECRPNVSATTCWLRPRLHALYSFGLRVLGKSRPRSTWSSSSKQSPAQADAAAERLAALELDLERERPLAGLFGSAGARS